MVDNGIQSEFFKLVLFMQNSELEEASEAKQNQWTIKPSVEVCKSKWEIPSDQDWS